MGTGPIRLPRIIKRHRAHDMLHIQGERPCITPNATGCLKSSHETLSSRQSAVHAYSGARARTLTARATLDPEGLSLVGVLTFQAIRNLKPDAAGGLTLGADPIALSASLEAHRQGVSIKPIIVRKEPKKHGTAKWIEGILDGVRRVVVIDDVITTGGSTITAIERMREAGLEVIAAVVIIDREEGGREAIEATGVSVISLFTRGDFDRRRLG